MPIGNSDCCGTCEFNAFSQSETRAPGPDGERLFFCQIRQIEIDTPFWTFCNNHQRHNPLLSQTPRGPLWAAVSGALRQVPLDEGFYLPPEARPPQGSGRYVRAPYGGGRRPRESGAGRCAVCGQETARTLALRTPTAEGRICFCSLGHYLQWWMRRAPEADAYRLRRPVAREVLYGDLIVLAEALGTLEVEPMVGTNGGQLLPVLGGVEGALVQASRGYLDLALAELALRQPAAIEQQLSPHLLRAWLALAQIGEELRQPTPGLENIRSAVRVVRQSLERLVVHTGDTEPQGVVQRRGAR